MSDFKSNSGPVPPRWLHCPRKAIKLIQNKFLAFKTPLSSSFDSQVPVECRFNINMLFSSVKTQRLKLGLWIDLTNTNRFYEKADVQAHGCRYLKLQCRGHGETPSIEQMKTFVQVCRNFIAQNPLEIIGIHCTHGFNRTGFLIISYLVETEGTSVDAGLAEFASARPPGIYKGDYIQELFKRYDQEEDAPPPPIKPTWCLEYDDSNVEEDNDDDTTSSEDLTSGQPMRKRKREYQNKNPVFMAGVPGVSPIVDGAKISGIQRRVQEMCRWRRTGFPGSQPVSMDRENISWLSKKEYRVSWKADGTRYMLLIEGACELYFIDRDNSIFQVDGLSFPHRTEARSLKDTLLDGEMVIDKDRGTEIPRYLVYDVIMYDGRDVSELPFHPDRYTTIEEKVIGGRINALKAGLLRREREPFSIRLKHFWDVTQTASLLGDKFAKQLGHEPDGLIFQPAKDSYVAGAAPSVLKWKPPSMNSVDFRLKIVTESGQGIVTRKIGHLFVGDLTTPYARMNKIKSLADMDNKIIECKFANNEWVFMRERTDKSFPNSYKTAKAVCQSISKPVTTKDLLQYIEMYKYVDEDANLMPPPRHEVRHEARHEQRHEPRHENRHEQRHDTERHQQPPQQQQQQQRHDDPPPDQSSQEPSLKRRRR